MSNFYLVQRLESKKPHRTDRGFDGYFSLDYMGSSEFEWGAIPKALKSMREQVAVVRKRRVRINGVDTPVFFVVRSDANAPMREMEEWAAGDNRQPRFYGKEQTYFDRILDGTADEYITTDAWWDIENNVGWALDGDVAERLAAAFNSRPPAVP